MQARKISIGLFLFFTGVLALASAGSASAQTTTKMVRLAKIVIDSAQLALAS